VLGAIAGRTIGWDPAENDGNPALWPPYVLTAFVFVGLPLLFGAACSYVWRAWRRPLVERNG
jgi:hypothetical protein